MSTRTVYRIEYWAEGEDRPRLDWESESSQFRKLDWWKIGQIMLGNAPASEYQPVHFILNDDRAAEWHSHNIAGTFGMISKQAVDLVGQYMTPYFEFLPAWVNNIPFRLLRRVASLDCLDKEKSIWISSPDMPTRVLHVNRFRFHMDRIHDPVLFPLPETHGGLFATETVKRIMEQSNMQGVYLFDTSTLER